MLGAQNDIKTVVFALARTLKLERNSLCFCGSGKEFNGCCGSEEPGKLIFVEKGFDKAKAFAAAHNWTVSTIPAGIWKLFESAALERLPCLYTRCEREPVNCHLIPENILRLNYGGHCKEQKLKDGLSANQFVKTGINGAGCLPVFCSEHDNDIFQIVDELRIDEASKEQHFMLSLKAIAFSLRKTQYILGIDSQVEIAKPFLIEANPRIPAGGHITLNVDHLSVQYVRFKAISGFWRQAVEIYLSKSWNSLVYIHRVIQYSEPLFAAGVVNPSHDLKGQRINRSDSAIAMTCTVYAKDGQLHVVLACVDEVSRCLYAEFIDQMKAATDELFVTVMNNFLTSFPMNAILMPEVFEVTQQDLKKIESAQKRAVLALKSAGPILSLKRPKHAVKFIRSVCPRLGG